MNAFAKVDKETFLRFVATRRGERFELVKGRIVQQMPGGTRRHMHVMRRLLDVIGGAVDETKWTVLPERGVDTGASIRYPDIVVEPADEPGDSLATARPVLIVEVLSPSSSASDLDVKPGEYLGIASLDAYIVVSQTEIACLLWARGADGSFPREPREIAGADAMVELSCRAGTFRLPLGAVYRGVLDA